MSLTQKIRLLVWGTVFVVITLLSYYGIGYPHFLSGKPAKLLVIPAGTTLDKLQEQLVKEDFTDNTISFSILARLLMYPRKIRPGAYQIESNMSNFQVIRLLRKGVQHPIKLVLHNIANKEELAAKITYNTQLTPLDFQNLLEDSAFLASYGFNTDNVLAMFIPNTYQVYWTITAKDLFKKMYFEYQKFWNEERLVKAQAISLTSIQVYILASIVVKEAHLVEEYPLIAGVYINRLKANMLLQACPTALYAANQLGKANKVLYTHLSANSPYNTYRYKGLPPGPITMPSIAAIDAVLHYQPHDYFYFVLRNDLSNGHHFSTTFKQHLHYVRRYKKMLVKPIVAGNQ